MTLDERAAQAATDSGPEARFLEALRAHKAPFSPMEGADGLVFQADGEVDGRPNRARVKLFRVDEGPLAGTPALFFYKASRIPFSRDRYSYGVCLMQGADLPLDRWLDYPASGFDPALAPSELRRAFPFTVPE